MSSNRRLSRPSRQQQELSKIHSTKITIQRLIYEIRQLRPAISILLGEDENVAAFSSIDAIQFVTLATTDIERCLEFIQGLTRKLSYHAYVFYKLSRVNRVNPIEVSNLLLQTIEACMILISLFMALVKLYAPTEPDSSNLEELDDEDIYEQIGRYLIDNTYQQSPEVRYLRFLDQRLRSVRNFPTDRAEIAALLFGGRV